MKLILHLFFSLAAASSTLGQVEYSTKEKPGDPLEAPWRNTVKGDSPDIDTGGWFYNLGITGIRVQFFASHQKELLVKYVFEGSPADGIISPGDWIIGADKKVFQYDHWRKYYLLASPPEERGEKSPVGEFAAALDKAQSKSSGGNLSIRIRKPDGKIVDQSINVGTKYGSYSENFPIDCPKSSLIRKELLQWLLNRRKAGESFGRGENHNLAAMAFLSDGSPEYMEAAEGMAKQIARTANSNIKRLYQNWEHAQGGMFLAEYYLATGEEWVLPELAELRDGLIGSQYRDVSQINGNLVSYAKPEKFGFGGWGHGRGYSGYGPLGIITGQVVTTLGLIRRCGVEVDEDVLRTAFEYLDNSRIGLRGGAKVTRYRESPTSGSYGIGRAGTTSLAYFTNSPMNPENAAWAKAYSAGALALKNMFPDAHASSTMGMAYSTTATFVNNLEDFRGLLDHNRWFFILAQCHDQSFYLQPTLDPSSKYNADTSRFTPTAATAFMYSLPLKKLVLSGSLKEYDQWIMQFPNADLIAPRGDFDRDGVSNLDEWRQGLDPTKSNSPKFNVSYKSKDNALTYTRSGSADDGKVYTLWVSTDLKNWTKDPSAVHQVMQNDGGGNQTVQIQLSPDAQTKHKFYRVEASE